MKRKLHHLFLFALILIMLINSACQPKHNYPPESNDQENSFQDQPEPQEQAVKLESVVIFDNINSTPHSEFPPISPTFTLTESWRITSILVCHWNHAQGVEPGEITLFDDQGNFYGTWQSEGYAPEPQFPNTYWLVKPDLVLAPGTYIIYDSDPATQIYNEESSNMGMARIKGFPDAGNLNTEGIDGIVPIDSDQPDEVAGYTSEENYTLRRGASAETSPESVEGITDDTPTSLTLSDGTQLDLPAVAGKTTVRLSRESTSIQLNQPGFETSGSTRVIEFELDQLDTDFIPRLTIPVKEMGELDPATVNILRVGPRWVDGKILQNQITFMPLTMDSNGDIVIIDTQIASLAAAKTAFNSSSGAKMASLAPQYGTGRFQTAKYVPMTFQAHLDWSISPLMVRMIPDANSPGYRRPANLTRDKEILEKPITNVITLVHGHNEQEKGGSKTTTADSPWEFTYKKEVWNEFYKTFLETQADQVDCTAFYEFIYPSFRPAYSPIVGNPVRPLGDTFARAMLVGAKNDGYQFKRMRAAKMPVNVYIAAHSMGGLVARAGIQKFDEYMQESFQRLVTWGTPHHGSPLVTLGYLFRGEYKVNPGQIPAAHWLEGDANILLGSKMLDWIQDRLLQLDTPGSRDLRWDNVRPLRLDEIFSADTKALIVMDPGNTKFNLVNGTWLYNDNLKIFNENDKYYLSEKYYFLYGTTRKRLPDYSGQTAIGATLLPALLKDPEKTISYCNGPSAEGESDGAVPLASMAGVGITSYRDNLGNMDHEEYYSSASDNGRKTARATINAFGFEKPRCACAKVVIEVPENNKAGFVTSGFQTINASLILDTTLAPFPWKWIQSAEAIIYPKGYPDNFETLGNLDVTETGEMSGTITVPEAGEEQMILIVRVVLCDGTKLDSDPITITEAMLRFEGGDVVYVEGYKLKGSTDSAYAYYDAIYYYKDAPRDSTIELDFGDGIPHPGYDVYTNYGTPGEGGWVMVYLPEIYLEGDGPFTFTVRMYTKDGELVAQCSQLVVLNIEYYEYIPDWRIPEGD